MKNSNFLIVMCLSALFIVSSCSSDDPIISKNISQNADSSMNARFTAQNKSYSATFSKDYVFNNISLNGNNTLAISVSNTGTTSANMEVMGNNGYYYIATKTIPKGGAYYTYNLPVSGMSGNVVIRIGSTTSTGTVKGNLQLSSF